MFGMTTAYPGQAGIENNRFIGAGKRVGEPGGGMATSNE